MPTKEEISKMKRVPMDLEMDQIARSWITHIKDFNKPYYSDLKKQGQLRNRAIQKSEEYWRDLHALKKWDYAPGGAEEVARRTLYQNP